MGHLPSPADRKRILIVEDDEDERLLMEEFFPRHFEITGFANNYDNLLKKLQPGHLPQIILTNLSLPRKNGLEILQELKKNKAYQEIPVILISAAFSDMIVRQAMQMGASACIEKPNVVAEYQSFSASIYALLQAADDLPTADHC